MALFRAIYRGVAWVANAPRALIGTYLVLIIVGGSIYSVLEDKSFGDSVWWAVVTASTVGYGDTYPSTVGGRFVAGTLISLMVLIVIPLITAHFASKLIVDQDAFRHEEQEEIKNNLRTIRQLTERLAAQVGLDPSAGLDPTAGAAGPSAGLHPSAGAAGPSEREAERDRVSGLGSAAHPPAP